jgi:RecJ-like exonuclease
MKFDAQDNCLLGTTDTGFLIRVPLFLNCSSCDGTGKKEVQTDCVCRILGQEPDADCLVCEGKGEVTSAVACPDCKGEGRVVEEHNARLIASALGAIGYCNQGPEITRIG